MLAQLSQSDGLTVIYAAMMLILACTPVVRLMDYVLKNEEILAQNGAMMNGEASDFMVKTYLFGGVACAWGIIMLLGGAISMLLELSKA